MKAALKVLGVLVLLVLVSGGGFFLWASSSSAKTLARTIETHRAEFPIPFPLDSAAAAGLTPDSAAAVALAQAQERGEHLVESRYACLECHGENLGGGVMIDAPAIGRLLGPNITTGAGSKTLTYTAVDWDRIVRHGVLPDGRPAAMPSMDFVSMSDQELSDVIVYVRSLAPVDNTVPGPTLGPIGKILMATGKLLVSADQIDAHDAAHLTIPPVAAPTIEFGKHMAAPCTGCHAENLAGGPIVGGDPAWPPAGNLTPHATGIAGWTLEQFTVALREARRPDGTALLPPMNGMIEFAANKTDVEIEALYLYLQSLPPTPKPG